MLRTILLASPIVLFALVSCGDSSSSFEDVPADTAGTASSLGGSVSGGKGNQAGSPTTAGSSQGGTGNSGGTKNQAGNGNTAGTKNQAGGGGQGGTANQAGSGNTAGTKNQAGGGGQGGTANQAGTANAGTSSDLAGAGGTAGGTGDGGAGGSDGALCPDIFGNYEIKDKEGTCNGLNTDAPQTIEGTTSACAAHFVSTPASGAQGVNGGADLDAKGNFKSSKLYLDATQRNPCNGTWNAQEATMTIECGGPADRCTVLLRRK